MKGQSERSDSKFRLCYRVGSAGDIRYDTERHRIGDIVTARFSNTSGAKTFRGKIVGRTDVRYWLVEALEPVWGNDIGRVFQIYSRVATQHSPENGIVADDNAPSTEGSIAYLTTSDEDGKRTANPVDASTLALFVRGSKRYPSLAAARHELSLLGLPDHAVIVAVANDPFSRGQQGA